MYWVIKEKCNTYDERIADEGVSLHRIQITFNLKTNVHNKSATINYKIEIVNP